MAFGLSAGTIGCCCLIWAAACGRISFESLDASVDFNAASCLAAEGGDSAFGIENFALEYATPNSLRLRWDGTASEGSFDRYEVWVVPAQSEQAECEVKTYDGVSNPELGYYTLPEPSGYKVFATTLEKLEPDTGYILQLIAYDADGQRTASPALALQTRPSPTQSVLLFGDDETAGYSIPAGLELTSGDAYAGSQYYEYVSTCTGTCFENLRRQDIGVSLASMSDVDFEDAYYEFALATSGGQHSWWSQVRLSFTQADDSHELFVYAPFVHRADGDYVVYQVPLRMFGQDELTVPLTHEIASREVFEFTVGGEWALGETVRLDELYIRW